MCVRDGCDVWPCTADQKAASASAANDFARVSGQVYTVADTEIPIAAALGHVEMIQWWHNHGDTKPTLATIIRRFHAGHPVVVEWLLTALEPEDNIQALNLLEPYQLVTHVARFGNLSATFASWKALSAVFAARLGDLTALKQHHDSDMDTAMQRVRRANAPYVVEYLRATQKGDAVREHIPLQFLIGHPDMIAYVCKTANLNVPSTLGAATLGFLTDAKILAFDSDADAECTSGMWYTICSIGDVRLVRVVLNCIAVNVNDIYDRATLATESITAFVHAMGNSSSK
ncbi:Aste57867_9990 [Aphanomyces stellatus]|uniref:Aste57867_9990 protein n=1 Tax=Aphanomyces stellatus TaxID=120398 RepID=A0A485KPQ1_9STRA|nr:hypothetical protein As57867_009951 [Aphanomyces stellatus]VFT86868.1 Aste57867_9990 [Aphanomyces stellatus]